MKLIKNLFILSIITFLAVSCEKGIDPITAISPGTDMEDPTIAITFPEVGKIVRSQDSIANITFKFTAVDDIELKSIVIQLDGTEIGNLTTFKDYRRAVVDFYYDQLTDGNHTLLITVTDLSGKVVSKSLAFRKVTVEPYTPLNGEILYLPLDGDYMDLITGKEAAKTGSPTFAEGIIGDAYKGAADSYLTYAADELMTSTEFSMAFWIKVNSLPTRAGVISISSPRTPSDSSRISGFRFLREGTEEEQKFGINFGIGKTEVWMNPFYTFTPDNSWIHVAISISNTKANVYINGEMVMETEIDAPLSWKDCTSMTIASGIPNFVYWEHFSDLSLYDEMHFFNKAITAEVVQTLYTAEK